jgi:hypothetical protein
MESLHKLLPALPEARNAKSVQPLRVRKASSRSRNGCTTCLNRRVKCDERTPICDRCARGGFLCVYKDRSKDRSRLRMTTTTRPTTQPILPAVTHHAGISLHGQLRPSMTSLTGNDIIYFDLYRYEVVHDVCIMTRTEQDEWTISPPLPRASALHRLTDLILQIAGIGCALMVLMNLSIATNLFPQL